MNEYPISRSKAEKVFKKLFGNQWGRRLDTFERYFGAVDSGKDGWAHSDPHFENNVRIWFGCLPPQSKFVAICRPARPGFVWVDADYHATAVLHTGSLVFYGKSVRRNTLEVVGELGFARSRFVNESGRLSVCGIDATARRVCPKEGGNHGG
jgi:hypothetical protein